MTTAAGTPRALRESPASVAKFFAPNLGPECPFLDLVHFEKGLERQGYSVIMKRAREPFKTYDSVLTFLIHNYSYPQYQFLNQLLKRRAKWLIPHT